MLPRRYNIYAKVHYISLGSTASELPKLHLADLSSQFVLLWTAASWNVVLCRETSIRTTVSSIKPESRNLYLIGKDSRPGKEYTEIW